MSDPLLWLKWVHILSATLLFGTGIGTAFHMYATHLRGDVRAIANAAENTVLADWLFTVTSGVVQPVSGLAMVVLAGYDPFEDWLVATYLLYAIAGLCWFRVALLQLRIRRVSREAADAETPLPPDYARCMRAWFLLGWPAFLALIAVFVLMVFRPELM